MQFSTGDKGFPGKLGRLRLAGSNGILFFFAIVLTKTPVKVGYEAA
jgi:hypothetical protein